MDRIELGIVPQALWDRAQVQMASRRVTVPVTAVSSRFRKYLLGGFVKCATCGGNYIITTPFSYRCGTFRNRGSVACANHLAASGRKLEHVVIEGLRHRLYTEETLRNGVDRVREDLRARARLRAAGTGANDLAKELRRLEREIEHIKQAVRLGKATSTLLGMLEEAERRRTA